MLKNYDELADVSEALTFVHASSGFLRPRSPEVSRNEFGSPVRMHTHR